MQVVEARDRVGGRVHTISPHGTPIDVGGQWIGPGQPRMYALLEELGLSTFPSPTGGRQVLDLEGRISTYKGTVPNVGVVHLAQLQWLLWRIERFKRQVPADAPWESALAERLDGITVEGWTRRHFPSDVVRKLVRPVVRIVFGADPGELSMLQFIHYVSSAGSFDALVDVEGGFQQDRIVGGAQAIAEGLADQVGRERIALGEPVHTIAQDADGVSIVTPGSTFRGRQVIVAVPLGILARIHFQPGLPSMRDQLHQRCPMGATVKVIAAYERAFWREKGLSGEAVCTSGPISVTFDTTSPDGPPMLLAFVTGTPARDWGSRSPEARTRQVLAQLATFFGEEAAEPLWTTEQDWAAEPYSGGCPITQFPPGTLSVFGPLLREPVGRIHWAGTETAVRCTGFMEGAVISGEAAAAEVLAAGWG